MITWRRDERVLWRRHLDGLVTLPPGHEALLIINDTGRRIWEVLERPMAQAELVEALSKVFDRDPASLDAEVVAFLAELEAADALVSA